MKQIDEAESAVREIISIFDGIHNPLTIAAKRLEDVLGRAQNEPPYGERDGSISEEQWMTLKALASSTRADLEAFKNWRKSIPITMGKR